MPRRAGAVSDRRQPLFDPDDAADRARADAAADDLFALARELGGTVSGEHGVGKLKVCQLSAQWDDAAVGAQEAIKRALDPEGLFNPGTKDPRPVAPSSWAAQ